MEDKIQNFTRQKIKFEPMKQPKPDVSPERDDSFTNNNIDTVVDKIAILKLKIKQENEVKIK